MRVFLFFGSEIRILQSYLVEFSVPSSVILGTGCSFCALLHCECNVLTSKTATIYRAAGAMMQSESVGRVVMATIAGIVRLNALVDVDITVIQATVGKQSLRNQRSTVSVQFGEDGGSRPSGRRLLGAVPLSTSRHLLGDENGFVLGDTDGSGIFDSLDVLFLQSFLLVQFMPDDPPVCTIVCQQRSSLSSWQISQLNPLRSPNAQAGISTDSDVQFLLKVLVGKSFFLTMLKVNAKIGSFQILFDLVDFKGVTNPSYAQGLIFLRTLANPDISFDTDFSQTETSLTITASARASNLGIATLSSAVIYDEANIPIQIIVRALGPDGSVSQDRTVVFLPNGPVATFNALSSNSSMLPTVIPRYIPVLNCKYLCESAAGMFLDFSTQPATWLDTHTVHVKFALVTPELQGFPFQPASHAPVLPASTQQTVFVLGRRQRFVGSSFNVTFMSVSNRTSGLFRLTGVPLVSAGGVEYNQNVFFLSGNRSVTLTLVLPNLGMNIVQIWVVQQLVEKTVVPVPARPILTAFFTGLGRRLLQISAQPLCPWAIQWSTIGGLDDACAVQLTSIWSDGASEGDTLVCTRYPCTVTYGGYEIRPNITVLRPALLQLTVQKTLVAIRERAHWRATCVLDPIGVRVAVNVRALQAGVMTVTPANSLILNNHSYRGVQSGMSVLTFGGTASVTINVSNALDPPTKLEVFAFVNVVFSIGDGEMNATFVTRDWYPGERVYLFSQAVFSNWFALALTTGIDANYSVTPGINISLVEVNKALQIREDYTARDAQMALVTFKGIQASVRGNIIPVAPVDLVACCNDSYVTYPGSASLGLGGLSASFRVSNITAIMPNGELIPVSMNDPRMSELHDPFVFRYTEGAWRVWSYTQVQLGPSFIVLVYTQPGSLAQINTTLRVQVVDVKSFVVQAQYPRGGDANGLYRLHCSDSFQGITWGGYFNMGRFWIDVSDAIILSVSNRTVLAVSGRSIWGAAGGRSDVSIIAHGFMQTRSVVVINTSVRVVSLNAPDYELTGTEGSSVPLGLTGILQSGETISRLEEIVPVQAQGPPEIVYAGGRLIFASSSVSGLEWTLTLSLFPCDGYLVKIVRRISVRISARPGSADVEYVRTTAPTQHAFELVGDKVVAFFAEIWADSPLLGCRSMDLSGLTGCKVDPAYNRALFSGVVLRPYQSRLVFGWIQTSAPLRWLGGLLETTDIAMTTRQSRIAAGRIGAPPDIPLLQAMPIVDTGTLARQFRGLLASSPPALLDIERNLQLMLRQTFLVDARLYSNDFELSALFRITDRFLAPLDQTHAGMTVLFRTDALPVLEGMIQTEAGLLAECKHTQDGWFVAEWVQQIPQLNLSVSYTLCARNCTDWKERTTWDLPSPLVTGQAVAQCPRGAYAPGTILAQYTALGNGTLHLSDHAIQKIACNVRVASRRILVSQDSGGRLSLAVAVESFNRLSEINFAVMSQHFMDVIFPLLNFTVAKLERSGIRFINDSADVKADCPKGLYMDADGLSKPLPMHADPGPDCYQFECIAGYQAEGQLCVPVSFSSNLVWTIVVIVLSLAVAVSVVLCTLQLLCMKRAEEEVRFDVGDEDGTLPPDPQAGDTEELTEMDLDALGLVKMDPLTRTLLGDQYSPLVSPTQR